jgi:hypothetical protein
MRVYPPGYPRSRALSYSAHIPTHEGASTGDGQLMGRGATPATCDASRHPPGARCKPGPEGKGAPGKGGIPAPERTTVRTSREVPDETPAGTPHAPERCEAVFGGEHAASKNESESQRLSLGPAVRTRLTLRAGCVLYPTGRVPGGRGPRPPAGWRIGPFRAPAGGPFRSADVGCRKSPRRVPETAPENVT